MERTSPHQQELRGRPRHHQRLQARPPGGTPRLTPPLHTGGCRYRRHRSSEDARRRRRCGRRPVGSGGGIDGGGGNGDARRWKDGLGAFLRDQNTGRTSKEKEPLFPQPPSPTEPNPFFPFSYNVIQKRANQDLTPSSSHSLRSTRLLSPFLPLNVQASK